MTAKKSGRKQGARGGGGGKGTGMKVTRSYPDVYEPDEPQRSEERGRLYAALRNLLREDVELRELPESPAAFPGNLRGAALQRFLAIYGLMLGREVQPPSEKALAAAQASSEPFVRQFFDAVSEHAKNAPLFEAVYRILEPEERLPARSFADIVRQMRDGGINADSHDLRIEVVRRWRAASTPTQEQRGEAQMSTPESALAVPQQQKKQVYPDVFEPTDGRPQTDWEDIKKANARREKLYVALRYVLGQSFGFEGIPAKPEKLPELAEKPRTKFLGIYGLLLADRYEDPALGKSVAGDGDIESPDLRYKDEKGIDQSFFINQRFAGAVVRAYEEYAANERLFGPTFEFMKNRN